MMKKIFCILLCALMIPCAALAQDTATIDIAELMGRQASSSATFRTRLTVTAEGERPFFLTEEAWALLGRVAPGTVLETSYILSRGADSWGDSQLNLYLKRGEAVLSTLHLNGHGDRFALWGDALGNRVLTLPRDTEVLLRDKYLTLSGWQGVALRDAGLLGAVLQAQEAWPSLRRLLAEMATAETDWQRQAAERLEMYTAQLSAWMQGRTALRLERKEDGTMGTISTLRATLAECGQEAAVLLRMFYGDEELLSLLRSHANGAEAEAYLEPGMLPLFESALAQLSGEGELVLERAYDASGALERMALTLPLADGSAIDITQAGEEWTVALPQGEVRVCGSAEKGWQGSFLIAGEQPVSGQYQLFSSLGGTYVDASGETVLRRQSGMVTLIVTPDAGQGWPAQMVTVNMEARAGESDTQQAHWNADIDWQEVGGGAQMHLALQTRTTAAIRQTAPEGETVVLEDLDQAQRQELLAGMLLRLAEAVGVR